MSRQFRRQVKIAVKEELPDGEIRSSPGGTLCKSQSSCFVTISASTRNGRQPYGLAGRLVYASRADVGAKGRRGGANVGSWRDRWYLAPGTSSRQSGELVERGSL